MQQERALPIIHVTRRFTVLTAVVAAAVGDRSREVGQELGRFTDDSVTVPTAMEEPR